MMNEKKNKNWKKCEICSEMCFEVYFEEMGWYEEIWSLRRINLLEEFMINEGIFNLICPNIDT